MKSLLILLALVVITSVVSAQKVGVMTDNPQSVLHVFSSGQLLHPDGLLILGNRSEAYMMKTPLREVVLCPFVTACRK